MSPILHGRRVAFLVSDGFAQREASAAKRVLEAAGAEVQLVSPQEYTVRPWNCDGGQGGEWGHPCAVGRVLREVHASDYTALVLPGGLLHCAQLRCDLQAVDLVRSFILLGRPVAALSHGPQLLIEADVVHGRRLTSAPSIRTDLLNAGATWVDQAVVSERNLITGRTAEDLEPFTTALVAACHQAVQPG